MVCVPCIVIPVLLYIWHRWLQPIALRIWNPWAKVEAVGSGGAPASPLSSLSCPITGASSTTSSATCPSAATTTSTATTADTAALDTKKTD